MNDSQHSGLKASETARLTIQRHRWILPAIVYAFLVCLFTAAWWFVPNWLQSPDCLFPRVPSRSSWPALQVRTLIEGPSLWFLSVLDISEAHEFLVILFYYALLLLAPAVLSMHRKRKRVLLVVLGAAVLLHVIVSASYISRLWPRMLGQRVTTATYDGLIVTPRELERFAIATNYTWQPTKADIAQLESDLSAWELNGETATELAASIDWTRYKRIYRGVYYVVAAEKEKGPLPFIKVDFVHETEALVKNDDWLYSPFGVCGGGSNFLYVKYAMNSRRFTYFDSNAPM